MNWITAIVVYTILWWLTLFCVLPFGVERVKEVAQEGHDPGAPANPRLGLKVLITTGISAVLFLIAFAIIQSPFISFRGD